MKATLVTSLIACALAIPFSTSAAVDTKPQETATTQCTTEAKALKGEEREKALAKCEKLAAYGPGSQQNKMKTCNADAKKNDLHGDERRAFMSKCLKG
ncbi:PsiF family protein [Usitatibacter palustris]|uniref:Phosphate starvation-inducible protein PsiF n=1 Tax=Usitatibacter palustris TaxID=2732487 RepID=A0A6M4H8U8_9PROT|nr:PsiF family protein [Usitatibacter palustris]QJR15228.1 Phosphate starvation-inducible protein PsiF [Usitatibacter palustris]